MANAFFPAKFFVALRQLGFKRTYCYRGSSEYYGRPQEVDYQKKFGRHALLVSLQERSTHMVIHNFECGCEGKHGASKKSFFKTVIGMQRAIRQEASI